MARTSEKWIAKALPASHKGRLHAALKIAQGHKIPEKKLAKAAKSASPLMRKRVALDRTLKSFH